jgi:hypothetical protein
MQRGPFNKAPSSASTASITAPSNDYYTTLAPYNAGTADISPRHVLAAHELSVTKFKIRVTRCYSYHVWGEVGTNRSPVEKGSRDNLILAGLNNHGIADYILADLDGTVRAWLNGGKPNHWTSLGKSQPAIERSPQGHGAHG